MTLARSQTRSWLVRLLLPAVFLLMAFDMPKGCGKEEAVKQAPPPLDVRVADVVQKDVPIYDESVGVTAGLVNATITAQVEGYLTKQGYKEGSYVKKGQLLFLIDPRPFEAAMQQAEGELARARSDHATAQANLDKILPLAKVGAVSQMDRDNAIGDELSTKAAVASAQANLEKAKLDLSFTTITSPIDGIAGIATSQIGDLVGPASGPLTTVSTLDPIKVYINISEQKYLSVMRAFEEKQTKKGRSVEDKDAQPADQLTLLLADGSTYKYPGTFSFADREVDPTTGTIKVAILFPNPYNILRPGQFAKVKAVTRIDKGALLVPQRCVTELQGVNQVAVVKPDNTVDIVNVEPGTRDGDMWVINKGLSPGQRVVAEGVQKVKQGMKVNPKPFQFTPDKEPQAAPSGKTDGGDSAAKKNG